MTDLNRQCAEALGWKFGDNIIREEKEYLVVCHPVFTVHWIQEFNPRHDDAQAFRLAKQFGLIVGFEMNQVFKLDEYSNLRLLTQGDTVNEAILKAIIATTTEGNTDE